MNNPVSLLAQIPNLLLDEGKLSDFIEKLPFSVHCRDTGNDRFILANVWQAHYHGLSHSKEVIGLSPNDLLSNRTHKLTTLSPPKQLIERHFKLFDKVNYLVEKERSPFAFLQIPSLVPPGFICCGKVFKWPILNASGKTTAVFTLFLETTQQTNLLELYGLYKVWLPTKSAIDQFLKYLKISSFFPLNLTDTELIVLLAMRRTSVHKRIAQQLGMQLSTVNTHIQRLKEKISGIHHEQLLMKLRDFHYEEVDSIPII